LILPGSLILFSFSRHLWLSNFALFMTGTSYLCTASSINTLLQLKVDEEIRGRVMSLYVLMITGIYPLGSILLGFIANRFGIPKVLAISSAVVLAYGINLALSEQLREASIKGASQ
jgi:predicted MFS family arabinose efflux permease